MLTKLSNQKGRIPAWIGIIIVIVVLAVVSFLIYSQSTVSNQVDQAQDTSDAMMEKEPKFSYVGLIEDINDGQLTLLVPANRNGLDADIEVTVYFDKNTKITRRSIPATMPANLTDEARKNLFGLETISIDELNEGDDITVVSATDITGLSAFTASRIQSRQVK
jgi:capsid protein